MEDGSKITGKSILNTTSCQQANRFQQEAKFIPVGDGSKITGRKATPPMQHRFQQAATQEATQEANRLQQAATPISTYAVSKSPISQEEKQIDFNRQQHRFQWRY